MISVVELLAFYTWMHFLSVFLLSFLRFSIASTLYSSGYAYWFVDYWPLCTLSKQPEWWSHECWVTFNKKVLYFFVTYDKDILCKKSCKFLHFFFFVFPIALLRIHWHNWLIRWLLNLDINLESSGREREMALCHPGPDVYLYINAQSFVFSWCWT